MGRMPGVIIVGGPNGAGKTTFASAYLSLDREAAHFVNADEISRELVDLQLPEAVINVRAARAMLERIEELVEANADLVIETTLASLTYAQKIPAWRRRGYHVALIYLRLASPEHSLARVRRRVAAGGHGIPEEVVRRRFARSLRYLEDVYKPIVDEWEIWDSLEGDFRRVAAWDD
jgi:predicted ABC-type ATPase